MILIIDNYDSFTYNIYQYVGEIYPDVKVLRNDALTAKEIIDLSPEGIILSPGPGYPDSAGVCLDLILKAGANIPILGICLGFQAIVQSMGGKIVHAQELMHGKTCTITVDHHHDLFQNIPDRLKVARYHSLAADRNALPECLTVTATADDGEIMAICHQTLPLYGVQFHPEAVMTKFGRRIIGNFLTIAGVHQREEKERAAKTTTTDGALKPYLKKVIESDNLSLSEAEQAMDIIMAGKGTEAQIGSFLTALRMKGETVEEITGFARCMRQKAEPLPFFDHAIDIVGTGGDLAHTFNISTATAFVVAGAGAKVAKHGNRSVSSLSGSADVLEKVGVKLNITSDGASQCMNEHGLCFMFAPMFHKSMKFAAVPRKEIGVRSVFNILGPLANPARTEYMLLGVYDPALLESMAEVLLNLQIKKALVVHGEDGLDEVTLTGKSTICEVSQGKIVKYTFDPKEYGFSYCTQLDLKGGYAEENAEILIDILSGKKGVHRDIVILNAAMALYACDFAKSIEEGIGLAAKSIDQGSAHRKLQDLIEFTNQF